MISQKDRYHPLAATLRVLHVASHMQTSLDHVLSCLHHLAPEYADMSVRVAPIIVTFSIVYVCLQSFST